MSAAKLVAEANAAGIGNIAALRSRKERFTVLMFNKERSAMPFSYSCHTLGGARKHARHVFEGQCHIYDNGLRARVA